MAHLLERKVRSGILRTGANIRWMLMYGLTDRTGRGGRTTMMSGCGRETDPD